MPRRRFRWVRAASDRVPTRWLAGVATALFLAATAAFGGLATAAEPPLATIEPGQEHRSDQLSLTVIGAALRDEDPDAKIFLDDGERMLVLRVRFENHYTEPQSGESVYGNIAVAGLDMRKADALRTDDLTRGPVLQPGVPAEVEYRWTIEDGAYRDGDDLEVTVNDLSLYTGSFVVSGTWWTDPKPVATMRVPIRDEGGPAPIGGEG